LYNECTSSIYLAVAGGFNVGASQSLGSQAIKEKKAKAPTKTPKGSQDALDDRKWVCRRPLSIRSFLFLKNLAFFF